MANLLMFPTAAARRLSPWVVGIFLLAQIFGVLPLVSEHTAHIAQADFNVAQDCVCTGQAPHRHYQGDSDGFVQHHELQDLSGVLTCAVDQYQSGIVHVAVSLYAPLALAEGHPIFLERPPKSLLSA
jgi:hypothetical protein